MMVNVSFLGYLVFVGDCCCCVEIKNILCTALIFSAIILIFLQDSLAAVEEVMHGVCASVYRPVDCVLKALFTSPCELVSIARVMYVYSTGDCYINHKGACPLICMVDAFLKSST